MAEHGKRMEMNVVAAPRPMGPFGQSISGFILAVMVHEFTWALSALALWFVNPLLGIIGGFALAIGACAVAYDAVKLPAVRAGMRTYFLLVFVSLCVAIVMLLVFI